MLTLCKVLYLRRQLDIIQCCVACAYKGLGQVGVSQDGEAAAEGGEEDRQHPKVQEVPRLEQVLPRPLTPDLLHLGPDHTCKQVS